MVVGGEWGMTCSMGRLDGGDPVMMVKLRLGKFAVVFRHV